MSILRSLHKNGAGVVAFAAAAMLLIAPYGCSKEGGKAPETKQQEAAAPAAGAVDAGKEHFDKGVEFSLKGELDSAIKEYEEALKLNPNSPETHNNIGFAYMDKGDLDKAVEHQEKALELKPGLA
ncbi:MAG: tetratricopeptide repeat protein, partial [Deltaproteobacteria bacterium]|nr:tetratricopeptide repeat protein [Deltaproteobacteria bacterium]